MTKIAIAGANGFIGKRLVTILGSENIIPLNRELLYSPAEKIRETISGSDVVINLAGYSISSRWTQKNRKLIEASRTIVNRNLVNAINGMENKPGMYMAASAIGIYSESGTHGEESTGFAESYPAQVLKDLEAELEKLDKEVKLVTMRIGVVLGTDGGALKRLTPLFKFGLGGVLGSGKQVFSFIHIDDLVNSIDFIMKKESGGIYNLVAPEPVTNKTFTRELGKALHRPAFLRVPAFAMYMVLGQSAEIVLKGQTVLPERLLKEGYKFNFADIQTTLKNLYS